MKIRFILFFICVVVLTGSCSQPKKSKNNQSETTDIVSTKEEDFNSFLENFNNKPTFQRQRVLFPFEAVLLNPSEYGMQTVDKEIKYQEWFLLDFSYDSTYMTRQMDKYEQNIRIYNDSTIIEHRGIDNGIYANYYFIKKEGKWFLKSFTDISF